MIELGFVQGLAIGMIIDSSMTMLITWKTLNKENAKIDKDLEEFNKSRGIKGGL